jgi:predicted  nucleic acid-binding Zn-ribbon protein
MTDETANLILEHLRNIRSDTTAIRNDVDDLKLRMTAAEHHLGQQQIQLAAINGRLDRLDERVGRIERRLELVEA